MVQEIKKVVVGLSHTHLDAELIEYVNFLAQTTEVEHIYFVHVINLHIPPKILEDFPDLEQAAIAERRGEVEAVVNKHCHKDCDVDYSVEIIQSSNNLKGLLSAIGDFDADLVVIGRIANKEKNSIITQRLARRAPCQLLIVPEGINERIKGGRQIKTLLVPIDFSDYSAMAVERALTIARRNKYKHEIEVVCQYVFALPSGYHLSGKTEEEFSKIMCDNAKESYEEFIGEINTEGVKVRPVFSRDINDDLTSDIRDLAMEINADGIIIGSKGRTATAALFLGSFAEKLINNTTNFTLLVVRRKREYDGILDRLKKL
jgi:nucleotide-binding universal stress UspA family protein